MKLPVLILLLAFSLMVKAQEMRWEKDRPLVWKDFKGPPADGGPHIAEPLAV